MITFAAVALGGALSGTPAGAAEDPVPIESPREARAIPHGFVQMIGEALSAVTVNPDQEAVIEDLGARLAPLQVAVDEAQANVFATLAEQVKGGSIDRAALEPATERCVTARETLTKSFRAAFEELHEMLDKEQRSNFADALECSMSEVARAILSPDKLDAFEDELDLDPSQAQQVRDAIEDIMPTLQVVRRNVHDAVEAFRGDEFSLEPFFPIEQTRADVERTVKQIIDVTETILSVLDRDQVDKLATVIADTARVKMPVTPEEAPTRAWSAGRVRGFGPTRGPVVIGGAARFYGARVALYPVAGVYGLGL
jgi:hypothetical protein